MTVLIHHDEYHAHQCDGCQLERGTGSFVVLRGEVFETYPPGWQKLLDGLHICPNCQCEQWNRTQRSSQPTKNPVAGA